ALARAGADARGEGRARERLAGEGGLGGAVLLAERVRPVAGDEDVGLGLGRGGAVRRLAVDDDGLHRMQLGLLAAEVGRRAALDLPGEEVVAGADQRPLRVVLVGRDPLAPVAAVPDPLAPQL